MSILLKTFIKNLGNGRAWSHPSQFMRDFYEVLLSPLEEIKTHLHNLQFVHFPTKTLSLNDIVNGERLFAITRIASTIEERAKNVELEWSMLSGNLNYKTLEDALLKAGFKICIWENANIDEVNLGQGFNYGSNIAYGGDLDGKKAQYGAYNARVIANGFLDISGTNFDPVNLRNGKNCFYIQGYFDPNESEWEHITELVLKLKPGHAVAVCQIAERKIADNAYYNTEEFADSIDGGSPATTEWFEWLNKDTIANK